MGRFQLEIIYYFTYFSTIIPSNICEFLSCRPFVVNTTFSTGLVGVEVSFWASQETEETLTPTRSVENVVLTTKGLQQRNTQMLDGMTVEIKLATLLAEISDFSNLSALVSSLQQSNY